MKSFLRASVLTVSAATVLACGTVAERKVEYKQAESLKTLEMPPDLLKLDVQDDLASATAPLVGSATLSEYSRTQKTGGGKSADASSATAGEAIGVQFNENIQLAKDGAQRWLVVKGDAGALWPRLKAFWDANGLPIKREDSKLGVIETDWAENRGAITDKSWLRKSFDFLYSSSTKDKYFMRVERDNEAGKIDIYVVHRGMQQVSQNDGVQWLPRASDPELEAEMLSRLALELGASEAQATHIAQSGATTPAAIAKIQHGDASSVWLQLDLEYSHAWARVANVLAKTDITIEDFDRQKGLFYVAGVLPPEEEKKSWFGRMLSGYQQEDPVEFKIKLESDNDKTRVTVQTKDGTPNYSKRAELLLGKVAEKLR